MKKLLFGLVVFCVTLMAMPVDAQVMQEGNMSAVVFGTMYTDDDFRSVDGGGRLGFQTLLDAEKGAWLRVVFGHIDLGETRLRTIAPAVMLDWYVGKKWKIWWMVEGALYVEGPNDGMDFASGIGLSRRIWTTNPEWAIPPSLSFFGELSFTDATGTATGSYAQVNVGLMFNRGLAIAK